MSSGTSAMGLGLGTATALFKVVLYSFDGEKFRVLWQSPALPNGEVVVTPGGVDLKYLDMQRYMKAQPPYFRTERYLFTRKGLELRKPAHT